VNSKKEPWLKFYPSDWRGDPRLRMCSIGARGLWMEMMCIMHEAEPYGHLIVGKVPVTNRQLASLAGIPPGDCLKFIAELESAGVYSRQDGTKTIYSRRMVRDREKSEEGRRHIRKRFPEGKVEGPKPTSPPNRSPTTDPITPEARSQKDSEASASGAGAPVDHRKRLFNEGLAKLALLTGKGPDACRSFVGKCLRAASDDAVTVLGLIEDAERNRVVDASAWIAARLKNGEGNGQTGSKIIRAADDLRRKIASFDGPPSRDIELRDGPGKAIAGLLPHG
jgi:hypothetical protein